MATLVESGDFESSLGSASNTMASLTNSNLSQHFVDNKFYLLVVIGEIVSEDHLKGAIADIEKGIRSWDTNLIDCNLDQELKLFVSRHSARFSADVRGQRILHHKSSVLETVVLINPSDEAVSTEARLMVSDPARHKLLVLAGQCFENTGELILQAGSFSFHNFIDIFTDQEIGELLSTIHPAHKANLTLYCPEHGDWKNSNLDKHNLQDFIHMKINSTLILPEMEGLSEFTEYLSESVEIPSPFDMLEPPTSGGFLKLSKPCCYIFPGGHGDSALFAVNGFNMLINGGSDRKSCFWKLVRHLDRVDSVLLTHVGDDNLPGINSMLLRKTTEQDEERSQGSTGTGDCVKNMISPDVGVVFVNLPENLLAPEPDFRLRRNAEEAATTQQLLSKLNLRVEPLQRPTGNALEPIILFQKMGVGKLEMYVLSPSKNSKELQHFMKQWTGGENDKTTILMPNGKETELPVSYLTSISSLIVWHPANPAEKIVRVLFPGNATQNHILEGLEKLKHLDFLKQPVVTQKELSSSTTPALKQAKLSSRTDSKESLKSKPSPNRSARKESKEEASEKAKGDTAEKAQEKSLKAEKKEKAPVRKEKAKAPEKEVKLKAEQTPQNETPEKKKTEIKPKILKEKVVKREPKKSLVEKKSEEREVKKEVALKKDEKLAPKKEEKIKKEEKVKKVEVKKDIKKDFRRDSPLRERKEERKEQKKEADSKKDAKKPSKDVTKASAVGEGRKPAPKPKTVKKDDASKNDSAGTLLKSKDKPKSKVTKKAAAAGATAAVGEVAAAAEALETQRSTMSSPEDLTNDFEALKAGETTERDDEAAVPRHIQKEGQEEEGEEEAVMIHPEDVMLSKESPEAAESVDEGITTTEPEGDSGETPEEAFPRGKMSGSGSEKFEDEGTEQDYEEKAETEEVDEPTRSAEEADAFRQEVGGARKDRGRRVEDLDAAQKKQAASAPAKVSSPVSPAASIHDETLPTGYDSEGPSDEEDDNRDEAISGHTQSTMEISSVPTPMDEMSTPRDLMSDENTTNDETEESPSQDFGRPGASPPLGELDRKRLSPLRDGPESDRSKSDATEGRDYHASASTISPPSSAEEDRPCKGFDFDVKDEGGFKSFDAARLGPDADSFPLVRSPSGDQRKAFDSHTVFTAPVELYTTMAGYPRSNTAAETSHSPGGEEGESQRSPHSSGHTPYYQSPVEEKAGAIPPLSGANSEGPIIVEVTSDREEGSTGRGVCPVEKPGHESWSAGEKPTKSPPHYDEKKNGSGNNNNNSGSSSSGHHFAPPSRHESDGINPFTGASKEESKMSISEGNTTTSDKSGGTPVDEVVAEDTFSHLASASTASLATSSFPEPATDSRSLHAEVGSPHSTEVDDSLSVSVVQTPTTFQEVEEEEGSPAHEEYSPRPMSISPDVSPKSKSRVQSEHKSPEQSTISAEFGQESPDHSLALDFSKRSPEQPRAATENGPTEVDYSPSESGDVRPRPEKPTLFRDGDTARAACSASPSDASQSTPSVSTPCQMKGLDGKSPTTPRVASLSHSPASPDSSPVLGGAGGGGDKSSCPATETNPFKSGEHSPSSASSTTAALQFTSSSGPKIPSPSYLPLSSNLSAGDSWDPSSSSSKKTPSPHSRTDVDLCLVTSCEYRHPKTDLSPSFINPSPLEYFLNEENQEEQKPMAKSGAGGGAPPPGSKLHPKQCEETPPTSVSESAPSQTDSDVPPGTEECPSITADANIDSEDDSETLPTDRTLTYRHTAAADPPPVAPRDPAPPPPRSDVCMVDPETLKALERKEDEKAAEGGEKAKGKKMAKKPSSPARKTALSKVKDTKTASPKKVAGEGKDAKNATNTSASRGVKSATAGLANGKTSGAASVPNCPPMYMDLVYIPNHCSAKNVDAEFFKRVRSSYYVVSGNDPAAQEPSKVVLDSLLEGKAQWGNSMQVTLIPTHDTEVMRDWYQETHDQQQELNIMVLASSSTVVMQDESFPACKIEL